MTHMTHNQRLTRDEREVYCYLAGAPLFEEADEREEIDEAMAFMDAATNHKGVRNAEDLTRALDELTDLRRALPDNVCDSDDLRAWVMTTNEIGDERDCAKEVIASLLRALVAHTGAITDEARLRLVETLGMIVDGADGIDFEPDFESDL